MSDQEAIDILDETLEYLALVVRAGDHDDCAADLSARLGALDLTARLGLVKKFIDERCG